MIWNVFLISMFVAFRFDFNCVFISIFVAYRVKVAQYCNILVRSNQANTNRLSTHF